MLWAFAGRLLISLIFIVSGLNKIFDWQTMEKALVGAICQWQSSADGIEMTGKLTEKLLPYVPVLLGIATFLELAGGLLVLIGVKMKLGAWFLLLFLIPTTLVFHPFWLMQGGKHDLELVMFLKNAAICVGGGYSFLLLMRL